MSDEERRKEEKKAWDDPAAAARLAAMNRRIHKGPSLIPVSVKARPNMPSGVVMEPAEVRAWWEATVDPDYVALILDEPVTIAEGRQDATSYERGEILMLHGPFFSIRVPEWFLDGGDGL